MTCRRQLTRIYRKYSTILKKTTVLPRQLYLEGLYHVFTELGSTPGMGRKRDEIRRGLRSFPKNSHMIFYRLRSRRVWIVRVISMQRDIMRIFT